MNRYKNPRAFFSNRETARKAALAVNDHVRGFAASYKCLKSGICEVEAAGVSLPVFTKILKDANIKALSPL